MLYTTTEGQKAKILLALEANKQNNTKQINILNRILPIVKDYKGDLNKRIETKVNKFLIDEYGYTEHKDYDNKIVKIGHVRSYYNVTNYGALKSLSFNIYYNGAVMVDYNHDTRDYYINNDRNDKIELYSFKDQSELIEIIEGRIKYLNNTNNKIQNNIDNIDNIIDTHNRLVEYVNTYNDQLSSVVTDELMIKGR